LRERKNKQSIPSNPLEFFRKFLGFEPTNYQTEFVKGIVKNQFSAARWCRQSGKSFIVAAFLLWYALVEDDRHIAIVAPSFRQSKLVLRKIAGFAAYPSIRPYVDRTLRTKVYLLNRSQIECFPNNPDTIRGPTLNLILADELNFCADDEDLYDAVLFTLGTTDGKFIATSTPWTTDSIFYKIWNDPDYEDYFRSHVTWKDAQEPKGPLRKNILDKIRKQLSSDPFRWSREMEAEWAEDEDAYFPQDLITSCQNSELEYWKEKDIIVNLPSLIKPGARVGPQYLPRHGSR
jgi:phage terminase large subunit-like protein